MLWSKPGTEPISPAPYYATEARMENQKKRVRSGQVLGLACSDSHVRILRFRSQVHGFAKKVQCGISKNFFTSEA